MPVCGIGELAARIDVEISSPNLSIQKLIDGIWGLQDRFPAILVHSVSAAFGPVDIEVTIKTKTAEASDGIHPTWRIAQFVEAIHNIEHVRRTQTNILVHDPGHDDRDASRTGKHQRAYDEFWAKATVSRR